MKYSIIVPCFNEEENIEALYLRIKKVMEPFEGFEIIFVNDGSMDNTLERIKVLRSEDKRIKFLSFLTNYGHQKAIFAGLNLCRYEFAITMDADLQHPPEFIPELINEQKKSKAQIVAGRRAGLQKGAVKNFFSNGFYHLFSWATGIDLQPGISDFRLYTRRAIDILSRIEEQEPFLRGMISNLKLKVSTIEYALHKRESGTPSYTFLKSLRMAVVALITFSNLPVKAGIFIGILGVIIALFQILHYVYLRLFTNHLFPGQADFMVFLGLIGAMILLQLSLLIWMNMKIMNAQRRQPSYIIEEKELTD